MNKLPNGIKQKLIQQSLLRKMKKIEDGTSKTATSLKSSQVPENNNRFDKHPGYLQLQIMENASKDLRIESPFFKVHEGRAGATTKIDGDLLINFASYNYLGLNGHPEVNNAAIKAIETYGTSVSASRIVSGERPLHRELEQAIAQCYEVDDAITFVSGHAANVSTIGYLFGPKDLIVHDEYTHNSAIVGAQLSGAKRLSFSHNNLDILDTILTVNRSQFERVVIFVEGLYSMDGDTVDLNRLIKIKRQHQVFLMVDEAHSFGVLGATGKGLREECGIAAKDVDIWMGTLSKTLSGCGGYIAGESALIDNLRHFAPGFLYSVGLSAPIAAAAITSLKIMHREPERIAKLKSISQYFMIRAKALNLDIGDSIGVAIIPVILGSSITAGKLSSDLFKQGINVQPILYPAVPEKSARLRFFLSCEHTEEQVDETLVKLKLAMEKY